MISVHYESLDFPNTLLPNGPGVLNISWPTLLKAAITVGRHRGSLTRISNYAKNEIKSRIHFINAHLSRGRSGFLRLSPLYPGLDQTEKAWASYRIGMTMAKLLASELLAVDWLVHWDASDFRAQAKVNPLLSIRPDLVGLGQGGKTFVIEAKGRSGAFSDSAFKKAKSQVEVVETINGKAPLRIALEAFRGRKGEVHVKWADPQNEEYARKYKMDVKKLFSNYYALLIDAVSGEDTVMAIGNDAYACCELAESDVIFGVHRDLMHGDFTRYNENEGSWFEPVETKFEGYAVTVGRDGIMVGVQMESALWK